MMTENHPFYKLAMYVAEEVAKFKADGHPGVEKVEHEFRPVKNLENKHGDKISYTPDRENYVRYFQYDWDSTIGDFVEEQIVPAIEYEKAIDFAYEKILPHSEIEEGDKLRKFVEGLTLRQYAYFLCKKVIQDDFQLTDLLNYAKVFLNDISYENKVTFYGTMYVANLNIEQEFMDIGPGLRIRKCKAGDFAYTTRDFYEDGMAKITSRSSNILTALEATIELECGSEAQLGVVASGQLNAILKTALESLRLHMVTSAYEISTRISGNTILNYSFGQEFDKPFSDYLEKDASHKLNEGYQFPATLRHEGLASFARLYQQLNSIISSFSPESYVIGLPHEIAFHRYRDSLLRSSLSVNRIAYAIFALDAAFIRDTEEKGQKQKLLTRSARLMQWVTKGDKNDMTHIRATLETGYGLRNKMVHGGRITTEEEQFARDKFHYVLDLVRVAISAMLQLYSILDKDALIDAIELSQKDSIKLEAFRNELNNLEINFEPEN